MCSVSSKISLNLQMLLNLIQNVWFFNSFDTNNSFHHCYFVVAASLTSKPIDQTLTENDEVSFHCSAIGNPVPKITWIKDGKTVGLENTLRFAANRNHSGKYWCLAKNDLNVTVNASANLDVQCKYIKMH